MKQRTEPGWRKPTVCGVLPRSITARCLGTTHSVKCWAAFYGCRLAGVVVQISTRKSEVCVSLTSVLSLMVDRFSRDYLLAGTRDAFDGGRAWFRCAGAATTRLTLPRLRHAWLAHPNNRRRRRERERERQREPWRPASLACSAQLDERRTSTWFLCRLASSFCTIHSSFLCTLQVVVGHLIWHWDGHACQCYSLPQAPGTVLACRSFVKFVTWHCLQPVKDCP